MTTCKVLKDDKVVLCGVVVWWWPKRFLLQRLSAAFAALQAESVPPAPAPPAAAAAAAALGEGSRGYLDVWRHLLYELSLYQHICFELLVMVDHSAILHST
jgi:hypothetical protein